MLITKYTENFVKLSVEEHYNKTKHPNFKNLPLFGNERKKIDEEIEKDIIKILFRIEQYNLPEGTSGAQVIAEIIDKTIGSNYSEQRPSEENLHDLVKNTKNINNN